MEQMDSLHADSNLHNKWISMKMANTGKCIIDVSPMCFIEYLTLSLQPDNKPVLDKKRYPLIMLLTTGRL